MTSLGRRDHVAERADLAQVIAVSPKGLDFCHAAFSSFRRPACPSSAAPAFPRRAANGLVKTYDRQQERTSPGRTGHPLRSGPIVGNVAVEAALRRNLERLRYAWPRPAGVPAGSGGDVTMVGVTKDGVRQGGGLAAKVPADGFPESRRPRGATGGDLGDTSW